MKNKNQAFTLTELLVALGIVGAIAALSIPSLISTINKNLLTTQLKSSVVSIQQLMSDQLLTHKTKNLSDTDFRSQDLLLTDGNFSISEYCASAKDCWTEEYRMLSTMGATNKIPGGTEGEMKTVKLKNGSILSYKVSIGTNYNANDRRYGVVYIDVNGTEKPNIVGRDYFVLYVTEKGKIIDAWTDSKQTPSLANLLDGCKNTNVITGCLTYIQRKSWKMDY